ncbi:hypothetical protein [Streptomyces sp. NPDC091209]|uniref:hypothetical protein n=1 Tax=Streptomyces sp. NPDC091209 TaxID=3365974 RepID=UPI00380CCC4F
MSFVAANAVAIPCSWARSSAALVLSTWFSSGEGSTPFLAGCLRAPVNRRQAGTHASSSARVDIRRLQVLQLPLEEQAVYAEIFRRPGLRGFETPLTRAGSLGTGVVGDVSDRLAAGVLTA